MRRVSGSAHAARAAGMYSRVLRRLHRSMVRFVHDRSLTVLFRYNCEILGICFLIYFSCV